MYSTSSAHSTSGCTVSSTFSSGLHSLLHSPLLLHRSTADCDFSAEMLLSSHLRYPHHPGYAQTLLSDSQPVRVSSQLHCELCFDLILVQFGCSVLFTGGSVLFHSADFARISLVSRSISLGLACIQHPVDSVWSFLTVVSCRILKQTRSDWTMIAFRSWNLNNVKGAPPMPHCKSSWQMTSSSRIYSSSSSTRMHIPHRTYVLPAHLCLASGRGVCLGGRSARHTKDGEIRFFLHLALPHPSPGYWGAITTAQRDHWGLITPAFSTKSWSLSM